MTGLPPTTPTGLTGAAVSPSQINLNWLDPRDDVGVIGYRIHRSGALPATLENVTTFQDTGLNPDTTYTYRVRVVDAAGNISAQSAVASASTLAPDTAALSRDAVTDANLSGCRVCYGNAPGTCFQAIGAGGSRPGRRHRVRTDGAGERNALLLRGDGGLHFGRRE